MSTLGGSGAASWLGSAPQEHGDLQSRPKPCGGLVEGSRQLRFVRTIAERSPTSTERLHLAHEYPRIRGVPRLVHERDDPAVLASVASVRGNDGEMRASHSLASWITCCSASVVADARSARAA